MSGARPVARIGPRPHSVIAAAALALLLMTACDRAPIPTNERFYAFGTLVEISLYDVGDREAERLTNELTALLQQWHRAWHPWKGGGLARLNHRLAEGKATRVSPDLVRLLRRATALETRSGHRFDPAVGRLVRLWGFGLEPPPKQPPPLEQIDALRARQPRMTDLRIHGNVVSTDNRAVGIDLGGFAKGVAVGRLVDRLTRAGVTAGIVNAGGDLKVFGRPGDRDWHIGIRDPDGPGAFALLDLRPGESVFTSGNYERNFTYRGVRYHHILDPSSGYPAFGTRSVTVIARDAGLTDAAATALFVAGPGRWRDTAAALGIDKAMLVDVAGRIHVTPALEERLSFPDGNHAQVIVRG